MTWRERIASGRIDDASVAFAAQWGTCAVGEQRQFHPEVVRVHDLTFAPYDRELDRLGMAFYRAIKHRRGEVADATLDAIEDRVLQLKRGEDA